MKSVTSKAPVLLAMATLVLLSMLPRAVATAGTAPDVVLIEVNGEPITAADMDAIIMENHGRVDMNERDSEFMVRLLEKAVNDILLVQDARGMGMDADESILGPLEDARRKHSISLYSKANFIPAEVSDAEVSEYFTEYYRKILLRQISVETREAALELIDQIRNGADMAALAAEQSLDPRKINGGLHNLKHWADVEVELREASMGVEINGLSDPVPYRDVWTFVRVEDRVLHDFAELAGVEKTIRRRIRAAKNEDLWAAWAAEHQDRTPVSIDPVALEAVRADSDVLYRGEFKNSSERAMLVLDGEHMITEGDFRVAMSHVAMQMGDQPFDAILDKSLAAQSELLVLGYAAEVAGFLEDPEVVATFERGLNEELIKSYLADTVVSQIRFNREEFQAFYDEHLDDFRGDEEIKLSILTVSDEGVATDAAKRLAEGASFAYISKEIASASGSSSEGSEWSPLSVFSDKIIAAVSDMAIGDTTEALPFAKAWMILRLDGRRPGSVKPLDEVEMTIRQVMFQRKFAELLDGHLALLKERSEIIRHDERIRAYFANES